MYKIYPPSCFRCW